jgi:peptide/nickel transport system permease protein
MIEVAGWVEPRARRSRNWGLSVGGVILGVVVLVAIFAPLVARVSPTVTDSTHIFAAPSGRAIFGTDGFGRDVFSRVIYAGRYDLGIAFLTVLAAAVVGAPIGALLGYFGGASDAIAMRFLEIVQSFPSLILALLLVATFGSSLGVLVFVIASLNLPIYIRITRAEFQVQRGLEYVDAARSIGARPLTIIFHHIWPNATAPIRAFLPINAVFSIVVTAGLGFLGLGVSPPTPEWGVMIANGTEDVISGVWWTSVFPGIALVIVSLAFYLIGDGLERRRRR